MLIFCVEFDWMKITPMINSLLAVLISFLALRVNIKSTKRNIRLSMQQAVFKIVSDKAKESNKVWLDEPQIEKNNPYSPHFLVMTELVITTQIVDRSFSLFGKNMESISKFEDDYYFLFYTQLTPDLRGWLQKTLQIAKELEPNGGIYTDQAKAVWKKLEKHFEYNAIKNS